MHLTCTVLGNAPQIQLITNDMNGLDGKLHYNYESFAFLKSDIFCEYYI